MKSSKTILVIDDEKEITGCVRDVLERGYRVLTAFSGEEGLSILKKKDISLVILDYLLPDVDGIEILQRIKKEHNIPVIMITAHGNKELVLSSWRYRADYYFDKPFYFNELRDKVRELLNDVNPFRIFGLDPSKMSTDAKKALEFIWQNLEGPKADPRRLNIEDIAAVSSVSPKYLSLILKKECGKSLSECINILRVEKAKELFSDQGKDIKDVAEKLGFDHPNNFSRFFKKMTGKSPSDFKKEPF